jgi:hypothetical protein
MKILSRSKNIKNSSEMPLKLGSPELRYYRKHLK